MSSEVKFIRPTLTEALETWKNILQTWSYAPDLVWVFAENLCLEHQAAESGGFHFGFQTKFTPVPDDALEVAYDHFCSTDARLIFYRLGSRPGQSVCMLLCDPWFQMRTEADGFLRRDDWHISFHPGEDDQIEEISDLSRWLRRVKRNRTFNDLDFCMSLTTVEEIRSHGRPLMPYERFGGRMLDRMRRTLGQ